MTLYMLCALLLGLILGWLIWGRLAARLRQAEADRADLSSQLKQRGDGSDQKAQIDRLNNELDDCRRARVSQQAEIERLNREVGLAEERASMATAAPVAAAAAAAPLMSADEGTKPSTLTAARNGKPDDLKLIKGVGPKMERMLNGMGFYHFDQIADGVCLTHLLIYQILNDRRHPTQTVGCLFRYCSQNCCVNRTAIDSIPRLRKLSPPNSLDSRA